jgi:carboxyl-terminal processing protease
MRIKIIILSVICFFAASSLQAGTPKESRNFEISKNLDTFISLFKELDLFYVDSIQPEQLIHSAINKMLAGLDPYTTFIPESELEDLKYMTTGEYGGIGAIISERDDKIIIIEPYEDMPAQKNDLRAGDIITEINGQKLKGKTSADASSMLKGQPGEKVTVTIERFGEKKPISKEIVREKIQENPVDFYSVYDDIAYIHLSGFKDKASSELKKALVELNTKHNLKGVVLDLRGNPGGIIEESIDISNLFLPKGQIIVSTKGKDKQWDRIYKATREAWNVEIPMAVLVDEGSASASEIVAGAMQDLDRAVIIGNKTFGKGLVQTTRPITFENYLKVTTAKYYTPSGRCIQAINYENRDKNGRALKIADSLIHEFKTTNGRIVKDGGGIEPDIKLEQPEILNITYTLLTDYLIFDYATKYRQEHQHIAPAEDFVFSDEDFEDFKTFLKSKDFKYELKSSTAFKTLQEIAKLEGYDEIAKEELEALELKLQPDTDKNLEQHKQQIIELISTEIVKRYYFKQGEITEALKHDDGLKKAIEVLKDKEHYNQILKK